MNKGLSSRLLKLKNCTAEKGERCPQPAPLRRGFYFGFRSEKSCSVQNNVYNKHTDTRNGAANMTKYANFDRYTGQQVGDTFKTYASALNAKRDRKSTR